MLLIQVPQKMVQAKINHFPDLHLIMAIVGQQVLRMRKNLNKAQVNNKKLNLNKPNRAKTQAGKGRATGKQV